jgi:hypothetical protein
MDPRRAHQLLYVGLRQQIHQDVQNARSAFAGIHIIGLGMMHSMSKAISQGAIFDEIASGNVLSD